MIQRKITSCRNCEKRYPGCHGSCETYKAEKEHMDMEKEKLKARISTDRANRAYINEHFDKVRRKKR